MAFHIKIFKKELCMGFTYKLILFCSEEYFVWVLHIKFLSLMLGNDFPGLSFFLKWLVIIFFFSFHLFFMDFFVLFLFGNEK